jgi:hypothetical protein
MGKETTTPGEEGDREATSGVVSRGRGKKRREAASGRREEGGEGEWAAAGLKRWVSVGGSVSPTETPLEMTWRPGTACSFGWWLVLICSERKVLVAGLF